MSIYSSRIGKYRHRIEFQEQAQAQDSDTGEVSVTWVTVTNLDSIPAEVLTGAGREFITDAAKQSEISARINLRWFSGLQSHWRILHDGLIYNIESTETDSTGRREWRLKCTSGVNNGE